MDPGYGLGRIGKRIWRKSGCAKLSERLNCYGAYDFSNGECLLWEDGWCDGERTVKFLRELKRWREGKAGKLVVIWDNAPCHTAKVVKAEAARLGIELVFLPGYSPDLNPIERMGGWMRQEVTRGHCHKSVAELTAACQKFIATINQDSIAVVDRLSPAPSVRAVQRFLARGKDRPAAKGRRPSQQASRSTQPHEDLADRRRRAGAFGDRPAGLVAAGGRRGQRGGPADRRSSPQGHFNQVPVGRWPVFELDPEFEGKLRISS